MEDNNKKASTEPDNRFGLIVTALMIVIIVALAGLWIIERGRRLDAETALRAQESASREKMQSMGEMLIRQMTQTPISIHRDQLAVQEVNWDGQPREVLLLPASEGETFGLQPGDAILVTPPPARQSATQPAKQKP
ncbi:MAG: hypothetical protein JW849_01245 [Phycisphaerae bacterium]|nr:hypothetical protein [Phycisphaerae bacterium]